MSALALAAGNKKILSTKSQLGGFLLFSLFFLLLLGIILYKITYLLNSNEAAFWYAYGLLAGSFLLSRLPLSYFYTDRHPAKGVSCYPSISFVIAAKNEEGSIYETIESCLSSRYSGRMECIVVNDGSTDRTGEMILKVKNDLGREKVRYISFSENRGKREGMAEGVLAAKNDIIIFVDSDSFPSPLAVQKIVEHFIRDKRVGAVAGNSGVHNADVNLLTKMQSIRYAISFDIFKSSESIFGTVTCCPGCFSAYQKKAILPILQVWRHQTFFGTKSTFGDDRSLTNFVLRRWKVIYCREAFATTIVPETYGKFFKQQLRWKKSWIREGAAAASFMWKKPFVAALSFYINLILPIIGPVLVVKIFHQGVMRGDTPTLFVFISGIIFMGLLFSTFLKLLQAEKFWYYMPVFSLLYVIVLVWQMPYAILRIMDTRWGTR